MGSPRAAWACISMTKKWLKTDTWSGLVVIKKEVLSGEDDCLFRKKLEADSTGKGLMAEIFTTLLLRIQ